MTAARIVRQPRQERTREAWSRALDAGLALFREGGLDALTVSEVCRRAGMSPPSLYARVDGRVGLIAAVYEHAMEGVRASQAEIFTDLLTREMSSPRVRIIAAVDALTRQFAVNTAVLRSMIAASVHDEWVHRRGVEEAQHVIEAVAERLALDGEAGRDIATMLFSELVVRTMYGSDFASPFAPDDAAFRARLTRMALARAGASGAGE